MPTRRTDREKIIDEERALQLLAGFAYDRSGVPICRYPASKSQEERETRAALARLVRDYMPGFAGELLALAIDPATPSAILGMKPTRRVEFRSVAQGRPSTWARDKLVVDHIRQRTTMFNTEGKEDAALKSAEEQFHLRPATVKSIWNKYKKLVGRRSRKREI